MIKSFSIILILSAVYVSQQTENNNVGDKMNIKITSSAFKDGEFIPKKYTCDGANVSPPLEWTGIPAAAKSIALICDDPDAPAGTWVHWVIFNIHASVKGLKENIPAVKVLEDKSVQGTNDFRKTGYGGPCPPGGVHRYFFRIYALGDYLNLAAGATKAELLKAMKGHILAEGSFFGKYSG
jgi:Raf kinase inhibitor-like YbhB/YbcL family protein